MTTTLPAFTGVGIRKEPLRKRLPSWILLNGIVLALVVQVVFFWSQSDKFMTWPNIRLITLQTAVVAIMAVPVAFLLMSGYIDFAMGSVLGLTATVLGHELVQGMGVLAACALAIGLGAFIGLLQGLAATRLGLSPIIVTLGFYTGVRGLTYVAANGRVASGFPDSLLRIGQGQLLGIPNQVLIAAAVLLLGWLVHTRTRFGRHTVALGVNAEAAHRAGIGKFTVPAALYVASGAAAALAGIIAVAHLGAAPPTLGNGNEIDVLSAVLLGGVAFGGGRGSIVGVTAGVLFIGVLNNGLILLGAPPFWVQVSAGVALVIAAAVGALTAYLERRSQGVGM